MLQKNAGLQGIIRMSVSVNFVTTNMNVVVMKTMKMTTSEYADSVEIDIVASGSGYVYT